MTKHYLISSVFIALAGLAASPQVHADAIRAKLEVLNNQLYIQTAKCPQKLRVISDSRAITEALTELQNGDFLVGTGTTQAGCTALKLESIDLVGLKNLLGAWRTAEWDVYDFKDFNNLLLYSLAPPNATMTATMTATMSAPFGPTRYLSYTLAPEHGKRWSIFMADKQDVHIGTIEMTDTAVTLTLFDANTGLPSQKLSLLPISVK